MQASAVKIIDTVKGYEVGKKLTMNDLRGIIGDPEKVQADPQKNQQVYYARRRMLDIGLLERVKANEFNVTGNVKDEPATRRRTRKAKPTTNGNHNGGEYTTVPVPAKVRVVKGQIEATVFGQRIMNAPLEKLLQEFATLKQ